MLLKSQYTMMASSSFLFFLFLCYSAAFSCQATQHCALRRFMDLELKGSAEIDRELYDEVGTMDESKLLPQEGLKESDRIQKLPGQPHVNFTQYGGYVTVDQKAGRALFYYFVEAEESKESKPLLLWIDGGPGCSGLGFGAMEEVGPFRVLSDGKTLYHNPYAWNKVANVLFVENPAGVGFSYSNTTSDYEMSGDKRTAEDNYIFLLNWLQRFPEYLTRDFYITGNSYAGHYIPQLAQKIIWHNSIVNQTTIPFKGISIGNPVIDAETRNDEGRYDFYWGHSLISDDTIHKIHKFCDFSGNNTSECNKSIAEVQLSPAMDLFSIYTPLCHSPNLTATPIEASLKYDPCAFLYIETYLNTPEVQIALHANVTKLNYTYVRCTDIVLPWRDAPDTILPILRELMDNKLRIWIYSGDWDGILPPATATYALNKLKLPLKSSYSPWLVDGELGGYSMIYEGDITFATVRAAGHIVATFEPTRALFLISHFLEGKPLTET